MGRGCLSSADLTPRELAERVSRLHWRTTILAAAGRIWRTLAEIELRTGYARPHVEKHVGELLAAGKIERRTRERVGRVEYRRVDRPPARTRTPLAPRRTAQRPRGAQGGLHGG